MKISHNITITPLMDSLKLQKIDDEVYFSESYKNYISNSRLGLLNESQGGDPDKFFEGFKPFYSSSLDIGSAVHALCLQKDLFVIADEVNKPTAKMGAMAEELFKIWKGHIPPKEDIIEVAKRVDYYGGNLSQKKIDDVIEKCKDYWITKNRYIRTHTDDPRTVLYLDPKSREIAYNCVNAIESNKKIQNILHPKAEMEGFSDPISEMEQAILLDIRVDMDNVDPFILRLKSKLDHYVIDKDNNSIQVNDIKTLGKIVSKMQENIDRFHYNREFAMYSYLLQLVAEKYYDMINPTVTGNYLIVSTIPGHYTKVLPVSTKMFKEGFIEFQSLIKQVAKLVATEDKYKDFAIWI